MPFVMAVSGTHGPGHQADSHPATHLREWSGSSAIAFRRISLLTTREVVMIKATEIDWVISGHGSTLTSTQPPTTRVPAGMRLLLLAPPGTALTNRLGNALERGTAIDHVVLRQNGRSNAHEPATYAAGADVPNLTLHFI